jgi:hypothetical protein
MNFCDSKASWNTSEQTTSVSNESTEEEDIPF